jgi:type VI secretion system secreted protein Hcp
MPFDTFLKLDGIKGEGDSEGGHEGEIQISSFSWGMNNISSIGSATGGAGAGKASFQDFHFTKTTDKASPQLFLHCASGIHIPKCELTMRKAGGTNELMTVKLSDVLVSSFSSKVEPEDEDPQDAFSLNFTKIEFMVGREAAGWDLKTNKGGIIAI